MFKLKTPDVEIAIARHFGYRENIIVPNVSWGLGLGYECDLVIVSSSSLYATEIEIKVSKSDIKADLAKNHSHNSRLIKKFYFAVPDYLANCEHIPGDSGLISVDKNLRCKILRPAKINKHAEKLSKQQIEKLLHLGCMRIWSLKETIARYCKNK